MRRLNWCDVIEGVLVSPDGLVSEWVYCPSCGAEVVRDGE